METNNPKQRCKECGDWFEASSHKGGVQTTCLKEACQKERHRKNCEIWHVNNPGKGEWTSSKRRIWAREKDYWVNNRKREENLEYREREAKRMRAKRKAAKSVANRDSVRQIFLEKLESIPLANSETVANRDSVQPVFPVDPRVDQVIACLKWRETVAN